MTTIQVVEADWTWTGERLEPGVKVGIGADGRITRVGKLDLAPTRRLDRQALLPGFVNAHSHAFQRGLRARAERFTQPGTFWSWREAMYALVESLDADRFQALCVQAFREMLDAGITAVGEFHYLHHSRDDRSHAFDLLVLDAAAEAGIRLVMLNTHYRTGAVGKPLEGAQRRFDSGPLDAYWAQMDFLAGELDRRTQSLGTAAHSIRAVDPGEIVELHAEAVRRGLVVHLHVEEQRREVEECLAAHGKRPLALLNERLDTAANVTAVHCTHAEQRDLERFLGGGGTVCVCPLTEANLGDGIPDLGPTRDRSGRLSLGTDSNARIAMVEEMRWLEYGQRLRSEDRGVLVGIDGSVARTLLDAATTGGARALGLEAGRIAPGAWADFVALDLGCPALAETEPEMLLDAFVFGAGERAIRDVCVSGRWRGEREREPEPA